ncbi:MAG: YncE family protein [Carboxydocellales bacterium]
MSIFRKWKGLTAAALLVLLAVVVMAGCGSGSKSSDTAGKGQGDNLPAPKIMGPAGPQMVYVTGYERIFAIDAQKDELVAEIPTKGPTRDIVFSADGSKLYVNHKDRKEVAVIDTAKQEQLESFTIKDEDKVRTDIFGMTLSTKEDKLYVSVTRSKRLLSELKVLPPKIMEVDVATKQVTRSWEVPYGVHNLMTVDNGRELMVFGRSLFKLDLESGKLSEVVKLVDAPDPANVLALWNTDRDGNGMGSVPAYTLTTATGQVKLELMTVANKDGAFNRINLGEPLGFFSSVVSPDHKKAYCTMNEIAAYDLTTGKLLKKITSPKGTYYGITISPDGKKLYMGGGGADVTVLNADTLEVLKTIELSADVMGIRFVSRK